MKEVTLQFVLESVSDTLSDEIMMSEKLLFVKNCMKYVHMENGVIVVDFSRKTENSIIKIPFYNYLVVNKKYKDAEAMAVRKEEWIINGFNTFEELKSFLLPPFGKDGYCSVYVKCQNLYRVATPLLSYKNSAEEKVYVNKYNFYEVNCPWTEFFRPIDTEYYFEILGLCEIHQPNDINCAIISSLDDLDLVIEAIAISQDGNKNTLEDGTIYFNSNTYKYHIKSDAYALEYYLLNEKNEIYCTEKHRFCRFCKLCDHENVTC